jgi:hypothetical protein
VSLWRDISLAFSAPFRKTIEAIDGRIMYPVGGTRVVFAALKKVWFHRAYSNSTDCVVSRHVVADQPEERGERGSVAACARLGQISDGMDVFA